MKKFLMVFMGLLLVVGQIALVEGSSGEKAIRVCAYFTNTEETLDEMVVIGFEHDEEWTYSDLSQFIANECFGPTEESYEYRVFGLAIENSDVIDSPTYEPAADPNAYPTNIDLEMGYMYVSESSTLEYVQNAYEIIELDSETGKLIVEPVQTEKYYEGDSLPTIIEGTVSYLDEGDTEGQVESEESGDEVFTDVDSDSPYYEALTYLKEEGIISGYDDGSFKPDNTINRAEFTKIISGAVATDDEITNCMAYYVSQETYLVTLFTDVTFAMVGGNIPDWYFDYVCVAKHEGFVGGYPDGSFKPSQNINFAEAAKIITMALGYSTSTTDPWYKTYVDQLESKNAIPTTITSFDQNITRGEMAEMIWRLDAGITDQPSADYEDLE